MLTKRLPITCARRLGPIGCRIQGRVRVSAILPNICRTICLMQIFGLYFKNGEIIFSVSPLQVLANSIECFLLWNIRLKVYAILPDTDFGLYFKNGTIFFSGTWYVTISGSTLSPLQVSLISIKLFFHYGLKHNKIFGRNFSHFAGCSF